MTDNEIIKALEYCSVGTFACDEQCPCFHSKSNLRVTSCRFELLGEVLDLINHQKAEISELQHKNSELDVELKAMRGAANSYKAEVERLHSEVKEKTETIAFLKDQAVGWSIDFCNLKAKLDTTKYEAIKEFAEDLKERARAIESAAMEAEVDCLLNENDKERR